jgi:hypothetical protein
MEHITLFRGDADKIKEFDFRKTRAYCLVGQGVYLTNKKTVADSYRTKGAKADDRSVLFVGVAQNRNEAYEKAFDKYAHLMGEDAGLIPKWGPWSAKMTPGEWQKFKSKVRVDFDVLRECGDVEAVYLNAALSHSHQPPNRRIQVNWSTSKSVGYRTEFAFDLQEFNSSMAMVLGRNPNPEFWEAMWDAKTGYGTPYSDRDLYVSRNMREYRHPSNNTTSTWRKMRLALEAVGFKGFEYPGGEIWGGLGQHRAFCVWDDEWVNEHIVRRVR